jgi:hypothetical protein
LLNVSFRHFLHLMSNPETQLLTINSACIRAATQCMCECLPASSSRAERVCASVCPHQAQALSVYVRVFARIKLKRLACMCECLLASSVSRPPSAEVFSFF